MGKVAVVTAVPGNLERVRDIVQQGGHEFIVVDRVVDAADADALLTRYKVTAKELTQLTRCRIIGCTRTGVEIVPLEAATQKGIVVSYAQEYGKHTVSNQALAHLLLQARQLAANDHLVRGGGWTRSLDDPIELHEVVAGVFGLGAIGRVTARKLQRFVKRVIAYDPYVYDDEAAPLGVEMVRSFDAFCQRSAVVMIHAPVLPETERLFNTHAFDQMPDGAILVNTGRGEIVQHDDLLQAIACGKLRGAGLDVFGELEDHPPLPEALRACEQISLSSHIGFFSTHNLEQMGCLVAASVTQYLNGGFPSVAANPELFAERNQLDAWRHSGEMSPSMEWQLRRLEGRGIFT